MNHETEQALQTLADLGLAGRDVYLAELLPLVEMAWADGAIAPSERAVLESYAELLSDRLNAQSGADFFPRRRVLDVLTRLTQRRLSPVERLRALSALAVLWGSWSTGDALRVNMLAWAEVVAAADGEPVWDTRELFLLQTMVRALATERQTE